jgi:hypothetical protein
VSPQARKWAAAAALVLLLFGATLAFGQVTGTFAIFTADAENPNTLAAGGWIPTPTNAVSSNSATPWSTEHLTWTTASGVNPPNPNRVTGTTVLYADGGAGSNGSASCPTTASGYTSFSTGLASGANVTGTNTADWWCFAVESTSTTAGTWTTSDIAAFTAREIFYASGFDEHNVTGTHTAETNDQIILTFNQKVGTVGNMDIRFCSGTATTAKILVSTATTASCNSTPNVGTISGQQITTAMTCYTSTSTGSNSTTWTITLKNCTSTSAVAAGTASFTPAAAGATIKSASGTTMCTATAAPDCTPSTTDRF